MSNPNTIRVWDPTVRVMHWSLVAAFSVAYLTEDDILDVHVAAGYTVLGLVLARLLWGFFGTRHARFSDFVFRPGIVLAYLKDLMLLRPRRYLGHNPAGGFMIILLLISLLGVTLSGLAVYAADKQAGPLAFWLAGAGEIWEERIEEAHEFSANFTLGLVFVHILGVLTESFVHRENLTAAMWTGCKRADASSREGSRGRLPQRDPSGHA